MWACSRDELFNCPFDSVKLSEEDIHWGMKFDAMVYHEDMDGDYCEALQRGTEETCKEAMRVVIGERL